MRIQEKIQKFKSLDLSLGPVEEIINLFKDLNEQIPSIIRTIKVGEKIIRGTPWKEIDDFTKVSRFSYKPQNMNTEYQRASTPYGTMLYGSVQPERPTNDSNPYKCVLREIGKTFRENAEYEKLYYSVWEVVVPLDLVCVIQDQNYNLPCPEILELQSTFKERFLGTQGMELIDYFASEFAKEDANSAQDYKYMISAWFSKIACDLDYDGVLYPSVRSEGAALNVAIKPKSVDTKLKFVEASLAEVRRDNMQISIEALNVSLFKADGTLEYRDIQRIY